MNQALETRATKEETSLNPILKFSEAKGNELCDYSKIQAKDIVPAVEEAVKRANEILEKTVTLLESDEALSFENTMQSFIDMEEVVENVWTPVENLLSLAGTKDIREESEKARPIMVEFFNHYSLDERVYKLVKKYSESEDAKKLSFDKKRYLEDTIRDFKLSGAELKADDKETFKKLNLELSELSQKFSDNVTDSKYEVILSSDKDTSGLPEELLAAAKEKANELHNDKERQGKDIPEGSHVINLDYPLYAPFMKFSDRGDLRKELYLAYLQKATAGDKDNKKLIPEILKAKAKKAKLLGMDNYANISLATKMAESPAKVKEFLERLATKAKPLAIKELEKLVAFQKEIGYENTEKNPDKVFPWDKDYLSEKLRKKEYDIDENELKQYFELEASVKGMFDISEKIFNIEIVESQNKEIWHEDVNFYQIKDKDSGKVLGCFYFDLYPRDIKRGGAWMMPLVQGAEIENSDGTSYRVPQALCSCNLTKPTEKQPSLLSHWEINTLFHEFGHGLHHLLTKVKLSPQAGTNVEWDFVELPSQLYENFVWEKESLQSFAKHYKTGETIPDELVEKLLKTRTFNEGLACIRQIEFALFDLNLYMKNNIENYDEVLSLFIEVCDKYGVFPVIDSTHFPCGFSHIFAGGYSAGYYSYKWAEVLEADAFSRFQKEGVLSSKVGKAYKESILEQGDSKSPTELFIEFMGREPSEDALLARMGL